MRTSKVWAPAFATLLQGQWHGANKAPWPQFERLVANALASKEQASKVLSPAAAQRLQACFSKLVRLLLCLLLAAVVCRLPYASVRAVPLCRVVITSAHAIRATQCFCTLGFAIPCHCACASATQCFLWHLCSGSLLDQCRIWMQVLDKQGNVQLSAGRTEASARTAFEELMMEEEQAAARAAAKKAKKLKQKVKKKNKQQAASVVIAEPATQLGSEDEEEEDQFRLPKAAASQNLLGSEAAAVEVPSAKQLPSTLERLHIDTGVHTTAPARAVVTTAGAEPQQVPLRDSLGLVQSEEATSVVPAPTEQEGNRRSDCNSVYLSNGSAGGDKAESDAQFLQALFRCPITKVSAAATHLWTDSAQGHMQRVCTKPEHSHSYLCTVAVATPSKQAQASTLAHIKGIQACLLPTIPMQAPNTFWSSCLVNKWHQLTMTVIESLKHV